MGVRVSPAVPPPLLVAADELGAVQPVSLAAEEAGRVTRTVHGLRELQVTVGHRRRPTAHCNNTQYRATGGLKQTVVTHRLAGENKTQTWRSTSVCQWLQAAKPRSSHVPSSQLRFGTTTLVQEGPVATIHRPLDVPLGL